MSLEAVKLQKVLKYLKKSAANRKVALHFDTSFVTEFITGTSSSEGTFSNKHLFADTRKMSKCIEKNGPVDDIPLAYLTVIFKGKKDT